MISSISRRSALLALACAFVLSLVSVPALPAADKVLPLTPTFEKVAGAEGAPFVLHLKNDSKESLTVSGKVLLSVVHHAMDKARVVPETTVAAGASLTIKELSAEDRVTLTAPGYAPLVIKVPFKL